MDYEDFDDMELESDEQAWDGEDTPELEWDESETQSVVRDLGITSAL